MLSKLNLYTGLKINNNNNVKHKGYKQSSIDPLSVLLHDTLTLSFNGDVLSKTAIRAKEATRKFKTKFYSYNELFLKHSLENHELKNYIKTADKLTVLLRSIKTNKIELNINSDQYINKLKQVIQLPQNTCEEENALDSTFDLIFEVYNHFDLKGQKDLEELMFKTLTTSKYNHSKKYGHYFFNTIYQEKDKTLLKLKDIAKKLSADPKNIELRNELLKQEFSILYQELSNPSKYYKRAIKMFAINPIPLNREEAITKVQANALDSLVVLLNISKRLKVDINTVSYKDLGNKLLEIYESTKNNLNKSIQRDSYTALTNIYDHLTKSQQNHVRELTIRNPKINLQFIEKNIDPDDPIMAKLQQRLVKQLNNPESTINEKRRAFIYLTRLGYPKIQNLITEHLKNKKHRIRMVALWAMGMVKNSSNRDILLNTIKKLDLNTNKPLSNEDFETYEIALSSLSEYKDTKITKLLEKIAVSKSELSEISKELLLKANHTLEKEEDYFIKQYNISQKLREHYIKARKECIPNIDNISIVEKNWIDKAFIPTYKILQSANSDLMRLIITDNLTTLPNKNNLGKRYPNTNFWDNYPALMDGKNIIIHKDSFKIPYKDCFLFGHEWGHQVLSYIYQNDKKLYDVIKELFKTATKENRLLDNYAASNQAEYFCQGFEAFLCPVKLHKNIIFSDDYDYINYNTKYSLKRKDPELFKLINNLHSRFLELQ